MRRLALMVPLILLSSCASFIRQPYQEPGTGPTASIDFINNGTGPGSAEFFKEAEGCRGREIGEIIGKGEKRRTAVRAGAPLSFSFGYNISTSYNGFTYCRVFATFAPEANRLYAAEISPSGSGCVMRLYERDSFGLSRRAVASRPRPPRQGVWSEASSWCK